MKVKCKNCGKRFDYDVYTGQCPKCSTYYRIPSEYPITGDTRYDTDTEHASIKRAPEQSAQRNTAPIAKQKHTTIRPRWYYPICALLFLVMILSAVLSFWVAKSQSRTRQKELTIKKPLITEEYAVGEAFTYQVADTLAPAKTTFHIAITGATIDRDPALMTPEGYDTIAVQYQITQDCADDSSEDNTYYSLPYEPFLITIDGYYLPPLSSYSIQNAKEAAGEDTEVLGLSDHFESTRKTGTIYFLARKGDVSMLWITEYQKQKYEDNYGESPVVRNIKITGLEVK